MGEISSSLITPDTNSLVIFLSFNSILYYYYNDIIMNASKV